MFAMAIVAVGVEPGKMLDLLVLFLVTPAEIPAELF